MGYPMAKNLRKGLSPDQTLLICDVNQAAITRFQEETADQGPVQVITNGLEAAKAAVKATRPPPSNHLTTRRTSS